MKIANISLFVAKSYFGADFHEKFFLWRITQNVLKLMFPIRANGPLFNDVKIYQGCILTARKRSAKFWANHALTCQKTKVTKCRIRYQSQNCTQIPAFSTILDIKSSTVSLLCRASSERLVFLTFFDTNCQLH